MSLPASFALIGADGVGSVIRRGLHPSEPPAHHERHLTTAD